MKRFLVLLSCLFLMRYSYAGSTGQPVVIPPSVNVSSSPAAATAGTVTLSTPTSQGPYSAGYYNYVTNIHLEMYAAQTQIGPGGATPIACTSTNLPGNPQWFFPVVVTSGTVTVTDIQYANPLQATQGSKVTVTCPAENGATWNINVAGFQGQ